MEEAVLGSPCRLVDPCWLVGHLPALGAPARWTTLLPPAAAGGQVEGGRPGVQELVRNNHVMDMSLCHGGVLVEHECVCESRRVRVRCVGACRTIVESGREREFVPPQPLVVWG
jgi:hypothetical protein